MKRLLALIVLVAAVGGASGSSAANGVTWSGNSDQTIAATGPDGAAATFAVTATDASNNPLQVTCDHASGEVFPFGTTTVTCSASDGTSTLDTTSFAITVQDTTPPVVSVPGDITTTTTDPSGAVVTYSASATDDVDGALTPVCSPASGSTFPVGTTPVLCTATDTHNNTGSAGFSVTVNLQDTTPPVVTVPADISTTTADPSGAVVAYTATATDNVDGALTPVCSPASGATFVVGQTTVTCSATDSSNNTGTATFSVSVTLVDTTPPVVTVPSPLEVDATGPATPVVFASDVSATDNLDGVLPVACAPASGSGFPVGTTTVTCSATDSHGNTGSASFTVTVVDRTGPVVSVPNDQSVAATSSAGAVVTYSVQANDAVDGVLTPACSPASGSTFPANVTTTVTCTAKDAAGNTTTASFNVTVEDSAPTLTHVADVVAEANGPTGAAVVYTPPSATDIVDGGLAVQCTPASGATFPLGPTTVNCSATNSSGETSTSTFGVLVRDTTPPALAVPGTLTLTSDAPVPSTNALIEKFLADRATDLVDPSPKVTTDAPSTFGFGTTTVTFTAVDASGNTSTAKGTVEVRRPSPTGAGQPAPVVTAGTSLPERTPPGNVQGLSIRVSGRSALLTWRPPAGDFDHVAITRRIGVGSPVTVYRGTGTRFVDHRLKPGVVYRYLVVSVDSTGNQSTGAVAIARAKTQLLDGPAEDQRVTVPVVLHWRAVARATFYNVQVFRGKTKVFSSWPTEDKLVLPTRWTYAGKTRRLVRGRYTWYVWPARGTRRAPKYAPLEGFNTFVVVNP